MPQTFIPIDRRQQKPHENYEIENYENNGAVLFADISEFTLHTHKFEQTFGQKMGAEKFNQQLNQRYDCLIEQVHAYQGAVIGFSGDALTAWFAADDGSRAVTVALAMQRVMQQFQPIRLTDNKRVHIGLKIGIAVGTVRRFQVGDPSIQYLDVLVGQAVARTAAAEKLAAENQVVISQTLVTQLGHSLQSQAIADSTFRLVEAYQPQPEPLGWPMQPSQPTVEPAEWLLPPVREWLRCNQAAYLAQFRPATALFLNFAGFDYDHDRAVGDKLDQFVQRVQRLADEAGGFLVQLTVGDKGSYLYIAFGAPLTRGDDPIRAVNTALALRAICQSMSIVNQVRLGLSCGLMVTGMYGGHQRQTYGVLGPDVILAARLMTVAQNGQILISPQLRAQVASHFQLSKFGDKLLKGFREPLTIWEVIGKQPLASSITVAPAEALVGRQAELAHLEAIAQTVSQQGQVVLVVGEAGVGKSHLLAEFGRRQANQLTCVSGRSQVVHENTPWYPWRQLFRTVFQITAASRDPARSLKQTLNQRNPDWLIRLPLLGDLLGIDLPDNEMTAQLTPAMRKQSLFALLIDLLTDQIKRLGPLLILIEDIHWIDSLSLDFLKQLSRVSGDLGLLLIMSQRPPVAGDLLAELTDRENCHQFLLSPLPQRDLPQLIMKQLQGRPTRLLQAVIQAKAQGNPLFVKTLMTFLQTKRWLRQTERGSWGLAPVVEDILKRANCLTREAETGAWRLVSAEQLAQAPLDLPDGVERLILARFDQLSETERFMLRVASVIGPTFEGRLLARLPVLRGYPLETDLAAVLAEGVIVQAHRQPSLYHFAHPRFQEVNYGSLLQAQRQQLHAEIGLTLEQLEAQAVERLAYHFSHTELTAKKIYYLEQAARKARQEFANLSARNYYQQLVALEERWAWRKALIELLHLLGEKAAELALLETVATLTFDDLNRGDVTYLWAMYYESQSHHEAAQEMAEQALTAYRQQVDERGEVVTLNLLGLLARRQSNYQQGSHWYQQALRLAADYPDERITILNGLTPLYRQLGAYEQALVYNRQALELAVQRQHQPGRAKALNLAGSIAYEQRDLAAAEVCHQQALKICRRIGVLLEEANSLFELALTVRERGDYAQAYAQFEQVLRIHQRLGNQWEQTNALNDLGVTSYYMGAFETARLQFTQAWQIGQTIQDDEGEAYITCNLGQLARDEGHLAEAAALLTQSLQWSQTNKHGLLEMCYSHLARVRLRQGRYHEACGQAKQAIERRTHDNKERLTTFDYSTLGQAYLAMGNLAQAVACMEQAADILHHCQAVGPEFPHRDYFICSKIFKQSGRLAEAADCGQRAYQLVQQRAAKLAAHAAWQASFLQLNRDIVAVNLV